MPSADSRRSGSTGRETPDRGDHAPPGVSTVRRRVSDLSVVLARHWPTIASAALVGAGSAAYIFRGPISDFFSSVRDVVLTPFGLGTVPVALWVAAFLWVLTVRRPLLRFVSRWVASLALVAVTVGIMGFFEPRGALSWFTLEGEVSLGGDVGRAIIGSASWTGALRLVAIFVIGGTLVAPSLSGQAAVAAGRGLAAAYVFGAIGAKWVAGMYRNDEGRGRIRRPARRPGIAAQPNMPPEVLSPFTRARISQDPTASPTRDPSDWGPTVMELKDSQTERPATGDTREEPSATNGMPAPTETEEWDEVDEGDNGVSVGEAPPQGKFNRLWTSYDPAARTESVQPEGHSPNGDGYRNPAQVAEDDAEMAGPWASEWARPSVDLLIEAPNRGIEEEEMKATGETIRRTLSEYGIEVEIGQIRPGPTVTMYGIIPGWVRRYKQVRETDESGRPSLDDFGRPVVKREESKTRVKVDSILSREKDLALALKTPSIRIETPVMGKSLIGIEVPNPNPDLVTLRSVMESAEFGRLRKKAHLPVALGKASGGETVVVDLAKMPHLLIAGATGSGKSVCLNTVVACLITEKTPEEMRLLLIDPKRVELTPYNGIPHLLTPVVVETDQVVGLLKGMIREMLDRYRQMEEVGVRNIEAYNDRMPNRMPYLVVAVDELADLMMSAAFDVEQSLCRLAQLGRATGIHLIVATQRPSVDVVTGLIKANFPSRISFGVTSQVDSRTILDTNGAEKLLGRGDMLYLPLDGSRPERTQGVFISDKEIERLVSFWESTPRARLKRIHLRTVDDSDGQQAEGTADGDKYDELLGKAIELAHSYAKLSTSLLQRRLRIGYPRAARLMDQLEERGVVGPSDGSKSRDVIMS